MSQSEDTGKLTNSWPILLDHFTSANLKSANFGLLTRLGLVTEEEQQIAHSVLVEPINEFTIYLPPKVVK